MKRHLLNILLVTFLLAFSPGMTLADVTFDDFAARPPVKAQSFRGKSPKKAHRAKAIQPARKKPQSGHRKVKPSKPAFSAETEKDESQQRAACKEKLQMQYKKHLQQAVSRSRQFAIEQVGNVKLVTLKALREGEKWAGQCKGEF
jgi:hypothetical protein